LPSNSIQNLGPALAGLGPVLSPAGTLTFDVVPELVEAAADGTQASARAAQITVSLHTGQLTVTFGLGYARAGARTIVYQPPPDSGSSLGVLGGLPSQPAGGSSSEPAGSPAADEPAPGGQAGGGPAAAFASGAPTGSASTTLGARLTLSAPTPL